MTMGLSLAAQTTGTLQGKVLDSAGKPIPNVKFSVSKIGINWVREITVNKEGKYIQVGFAPGDYDLKVSAPGYVEQTFPGFHIGMSTMTQDVVLLTPQENIKSGKGTASVDPSAQAETAGLETYNKAVLAYNEKRFGEALPLFETAMGNMTESLGKATDATAKAEAQKKLDTMQRPTAISMMEVAKNDETRREELTTKAEPLLLKVLERDPKDQNTLIYLIEVANTKKDAEAAKKYQAALDTILGPRPEVAYNQGVELYNNGKLAEAKPFLQKALSIKADYADAYYLLAMCEFAEMNLKGTKANLQKYLELAPAGKHSAEVKDMLKAPELKNVK
jgi:tetratricopeptide (TPR) repeat protein